MGLSTKTGSFNTGTGALGTTVVVNDVGFQPKVVFFWWNGRLDTTDAVGRLTHQRGFGYAVSTSDRRFITSLAQDTPTSMLTNSMQGNAQCIGITTTADAINGLLDLQSMDSGGFTLVVDDVFLASFRVHYLALGGTDIVNVAGNNFTKLNGTGNQDVEQVSFLPNFVFLFSTGQTTINNTIAGDSQLALGAAKSASSRYCYSGGSNDGSSNAQTMSYIVASECLAFFNAGITALEDRADFVNFHSSPAYGFRLNWLAGTATAKVINYVAFEMSNAAAIVLGDLPTKTDGTDIAETGFGHVPKAALFVSHMKAVNTSPTPTDHDLWSMGAMTSASARMAMSIVDQDAAGTAVVGSAVEHDEVYIHQPTTAATVDGLMDIKSVESDGFTCVMDDTDPTANYVWYISWGLAPLLVTPAAASGVGSTAAPTTVLGSMTVVPAVISAVAALVAPLVIMGSLLLTPAAATVPGHTVDPTVLIEGGGTLVTPDPTSAPGSVVPPSVIQGSLAVTPDAANAVASRVNPGILLGSVAVTPAAAQVSGASITPFVQLSSTIALPTAASAVGSRAGPTVSSGGLEVIPAASSAIGMIAQPDVILGSLQITPSPASSIGAGSGPSVILGSMAIALSGAVAYGMGSDPLIDSGPLTVEPAAATAVGSTVNPFIPADVATLDVELSQTMLFTIDISEELTLPVIQLEEIALFTIDLSETLILPSVELQEIVLLTIHMLETEV